MSDLVKYLRAHMAPDRPCKRTEQDIACGQAADEIERLQRVLQKVMARCADLLDEDQFNELDAIASRCQRIRGHRS
jgi:hypothetical protein